MFVNLVEFLSTEVRVSGDPAGSVLFSGVVYPSDFRNDHQNYVNRTNIDQKWYRNCIQKSRTLWTSKFSGSFLSRLDYKIFIKTAD